MGAVKVVHLYPKELNLYGDNGNVLCLYKRLRRRGFSVNVTEVGIGEAIPEFDILFIGGGQDKEMKLVANDIKRKSEMLSYCVNMGKTVFAICGGYQLLGEYYQTLDGDRLILSSALDFYTIGKNKRHIGNVVFDTNIGKIVGFENHSGVTYLSDKLKPFGKMLQGFGNDGKGGEGVIYKNTIGIYAHGPVLPKNPLLADDLIKRALGVDELNPLDDNLENDCHNNLISRYL